jgi:hypothetical protein
MKGSAYILAAIVALTALSLASPLAAADGAGKTPLSIDVKGQGGAAGSGTFTLLGASTADSDAGPVTYQFSFGAITKSRAGQSFTRNSGMNTLKGRRGRLVIRTSGRVFDSGEGYEAWTGTWSIVSGTGKYAGLKGSGGYAAVITPTEPHHFSFRYEGFVTGS